MLKRIVIGVLLAWSVALYGLLFVASRDSPVDRAIASMSLGLFVCWVLVGGGGMWLWRKPLVAAAQRLEIDWRLRFVGLSTLLALLEEAIATTLTNAAPLLGDPSGQAAITASRNYLEVVLGHSVIVFVPMFAAWAGLLTWRKFPPFGVFLTFGLTGLLGETMAFGAQNFLGAGFWILVYGLMIYLPACSVPDRSIRPARVWHYPVALLVPILLSTPVTLVVLALRG